jgi:hypothetical protein
MTEALLPDATMWFAAVWHRVFAVLRAIVPADFDVERRDRGAVSIEQVLWYAAAAVSVAVVAAIIWSQIRTTASTPVQTPSAP